MKLTIYSTVIYVNNFTYHSSSVIFLFSCPSSFDLLPPVFFGPRCRQVSLLRKKIGRAPTFALTETENSKTCHPKSFLQGGPVAGAVAAAALLIAGLMYHRSCHWQLWMVMQVEIRAVPRLRDHISFGRSQKTRDGQDCLLN